MPPSGIMGPELERLILLLGKLPGLGPRSARRAALALLQKRDSVMRPLAEAMAAAADAIRPCAICGNLDTTDPCGICADERRDRATICVVETVGDLWALERAHAHKGTYHVLGGTLSALAGQRPDDLAIEGLVRRVAEGGVREVILATSATVDGQTTAHYVAERLRESGVALSRLSHGVPVGGELGYLDDGTLAAALASRRPA